jgi:hypothetical protein
MNQLYIIKSAVCRFYNLPEYIFESKTRDHDIVKARQQSMYFAKELTKVSLAKIGLINGGKDHATVLHAVKTVNNMLDTDKNYKEEFSQLRDIVLGCCIQTDEKIVVATLTLKEAQKIGKWWYSFKGKTFMSNYQKVNVECAKIEDIIYAFNMTEIERMDVSIVIKPVITVNTFTAVNEPTEVNMTN